MSKTFKSHKLLFNNPSEGKSAGVSVYSNLGSAVESNVWGTIHMSEEAAEDLVLHAVVRTSVAPYSPVTF